MAMQCDFCGKAAVWAEYPPRALGGTAARRASAAPAERQLAHALVNGVPKSARLHQVLEEAGPRPARLIAHSRGTAAP